jgi:hypothetical protein
VTFEQWWRHERNKIAEPAEDRMTQMVYKQCWDAAAENERKRWANWIGNKLPLKHPVFASILWAIAEAIERNNFGVVAKGQGE